MSIIRMLKSGNFNSMLQEELPDGSVLVTLTKRGDPHVYRMWVQDLYKPTEAVIKEEVLPEVKI